MKSKKHFFAVGMIAVLAASSPATFVGLNPASAATVKNGDPCSPVGATFKQSGVMYVCEKSGDAGVWKSKKKPTATKSPEASFIMPKVVGMNLQLAQDLLQSKGSFILDQEDFKGLSRLQVLDSNWKICKQSPASGKKVVTSTLVTLWSVKLTERC